MPEFDEAKFFVIPHGRDFGSFQKLFQPPIVDQPIRILVPGNINAAKGLDIIYKLLEIDVDGRMEFHILGGIQDRLNRSHSRLINHGRYERHSFATKAAEIRPNIGAVFSIWDETYCHTLTELWSVGVPAIVFDFPTLASRVKKSGAGWVLNHQDVDALYREIIRVAFDEREQSRVSAAIAEWQAGDGAANTVRMMASKYYDIYRDILNNKLVSVEKKPPNRVGVVCPSASNLKAANASTYIRIWEKTQNSLDRSLIYVRMLPETLLAAARSGEINAAIIQRTAIPPEMTAALITTLNDQNIPFFYEIDDDLLAHFNRLDNHAEYNRHQESIEALIKTANLVTVSTQELAQRYRDIARSIEIIPNMLSNRLWSAAPRTRQQDAFIRALYMGTPTHDDDIDMILPALTTIWEQSQNFRLTIVGVSKNEHKFKNISWIEQINPPSKAKPYDSFVPWLREIAMRCDFAVAPLVDTPFNRCKSDLKILEYSALGLPVIASDLPQYRIDAPFVTLTDNDQQAWEHVLSDAIRKGPRKQNAEAIQRSWVLKHRMLEPSLEGFDKLICEKISPR